MRLRNILVYTQALLMLPFSSLGLALSLGSAAYAQEGSSLSAARADRPIKDKWALVIGINRFEDKSIPTLQYSAKDAQDFANFLIEKGNFARDHVLVLLNEQATDDNIRRAIGDDWLPRRALPDDLVVIYISTHGSPKEIDVAKDNFLIAHNTRRDSLFATGLRLKTLARIAKERTGCDRIVVLLDACNSGAAEAGGKGLFRAGNFDDIGSLVGEGQIVISSSSAEQRSWESKRYQNGVFTKKLMEALISEGINTSLQDAFQMLKDKVLQEVRFDRKANQTPVMKSKWEGNSLTLLAKPSSPRSTKPYSIKASGLRVVRPNQKAMAGSGTGSSFGGSGAISLDKPTKYYRTGLRFAKIRDFKQASVWYQKAASLGHPGAQGQLGAMYIAGAGVGQNGEEGVKWLEKSATAGDTAAKGLLGSLYLKGHYVKKDLEKARTFIEAAAKDGSAKAQYFLGCMYLLGTGIEKNTAKAKDWLKKAASGGVEKANHVLEKIGESRVEASNDSKLDSEIKATAPAVSSPTSSFDVNEQSSTASTTTSEADNSEDDDEENAF